MSQQEDNIIENNLHDMNDGTDQVSFMEKIMNIPRLANSVVIHNIERNPKLASLFFTLLSTEYIVEGVVKHTD